jgi:hypothetical protein
MKTSSVSFIIILLGVPTFFLNSCTALKVGLVNHKSLESNAVRMEVKTQVDFSSNISRNFGPYATSKYREGPVSRKDTVTNPWHFSLWNQRDSVEVKQFCFHQHDSIGGDVEVCCLSYKVLMKNSYSTALSTVEIKNKSFQIGLRIDSIKVLIDYKFAPTAFVIAGDSMSIAPEQAWSKEEARFFEGYIFTINRIASGALNNQGNASIWIRNDCTEKQKLVIAALSSALMHCPVVEF